MIRIVYSHAYLVDIAHVFPTLYKMVKELLLRNNNLKEENFVEPKLAMDEDVLLVHTKSYLDKLKSGRLSIEEEMALEVPYSKELVDASLICVDGSIMAFKFAMEDMFGFHIGGGFHHAFPDHGEGFCVFNDIAIAIKRLRKDGLIKKAMVIDCDLHQGNGTAYIFQNDEDTFTFSIHQENNYPGWKPASTLDIGLEDGAGDKRYLDELYKNIPQIIKDFEPEFIIYVAGADPYREDQLGNLGLSIEGLTKRDEFVLEMCDKFKIPVAIVLAGGYAINNKDAALIHYNTKRGL